MRKYVVSHGSSSRVSSQSDWHSLSAGRPHTAGMSALPEEGAPIACVACKVDSAPAHQTNKTGFVAPPEKSAHYERLALGIFNKRGTIRNLLD